MREALTKAFRWYIIAISVVIGSTALMIAEETGGMEPVFFGIAGYGVAYLVAILWKEFKGKVLGWGIGIYLGITFLCPYLNTVFFVLFGMEQEFNKYVLWMGTMTVVGIPAMTMVFRKYR